MNNLQHAAASTSRAPRRALPPIVLTADRTLFAAYPTLLDAMMSTSQTTRTPGLLMKRLLAPRVAPPTQTQPAPLGLRRIEAALVRGGRAREEIICLAPERLDAAIGPETRVIGISSGDPLGLGMSSTTMSGITGGEIYTARWFRDLCRRIERLRRRAPGARLVMGGPGAWQLAADEEAAASLDIDHIINGYCEGNVAALFARLVAGEALPRILEGEAAGVEGIPAVLGPTIMGAVEISRGCGLGCNFCTLAHQTMRHLPADAVLADVETNLRAGARNIVLVTEDMFRYGGDGSRANPTALIALLGRIREFDGPRLIQTDHANVASVAQVGDDELREIRRLMAGDDPRALIWLNLGVETASGALLAASGGRAKMAGADPADWGDFCLEQVRRLARLGFFPLVSLVMGLPGEAAGDIDETLVWVRRLRDERMAVFPVFLAAVDRKQTAFGVGDMTRAHWRLFRECYRFNFRHIPRLLWDNQRRGGASVPRRLLMQALGRMQIPWWKFLFVRRSGRLFP